jgi:hypothetical protein
VKQQQQQQQRGTCSAQQRSLGALSLCLRAPLHFHDWRLRLEINESARRTNSKPNIRSSGARGEAFQRTHTLAALKANAHLLHSTPTCPLNFYAPRVTRYLNNCHRSPFDTIYHRFAPSSTVFSALICRLSQISFSLFPWSYREFLLSSTMRAWGHSRLAACACSPQKCGISHSNMTVFVQTNKECL